MGFRLLFIFLFSGVLLADLDEAALLAAIRAHREEDTPRLMYADWLMEHNQPLRGELIQVQIALLRERPKEEQLVIALCNRMDEILSVSQWSTWMEPELYHLATKTGTQFRWARGFIHSLALTPLALRQPDNIVQVLDRQPGIERLTLHSGGVGGPTRSFIKKLATLNLLRGATHLTVALNIPPYQLAELLAASENLRTLLLVGDGLVTDAHLRVLAQSPAAPKLRALGLTGAVGSGSNPCNISEAGLANIVGSDRFPNLGALRMVSYHLSAAPFISRPRLPALRSLDLRGSVARAGHTEALIQSSVFPQLHSFGAPGLEEVLEDAVHTHRLDPTDTLHWILQSKHNLLALHIPWLAHLPGALWRTLQTNRRTMGRKTCAERLALEAQVNPEYFFP